MEKDFVNFRKEQERLVELYKKNIIDLSKPFWWLKEDGD